MQIAFASILYRFVLWRTEVKHTNHGSVKTARMCIELKLYYSRLILSKYFFDEILYTINTAPNKSYTK